MLFCAVLCCLPRTYELIVLSNISMRAVCCLFIVFLSSLLPHIVGKVCVMNFIIFFQLRRPGLFMWWLVSTIMIMKKVKSTVCERKLTILNNNKLTIILHCRFSLQLYVRMKIYCRLNFELQRFVLIRPMAAVYCFKPKLITTCSLTCSLLCGLLRVTVVSFHWNRLAVGGAIVNSHP